MMIGDQGEKQDWKVLAAQKEKEWRELTELRIQSLENEIQAKDKKISEEGTKFQQLKEDFKYNLRLIAERDQELERYDLTVSEYKAQLNVKTAEVSELRIQIDDFKSQINREARSREELQMHYQHRLREKQDEIDSFKCAKDGEIQQERKEFEAFKRNLQRQMTELAEEMDAQKRELTSGFEEAMKKREHEFRVKADEMSTKVLEYELKAKLLGKELNLVKTAHEKNHQEFEQVETNQRTLEKLLKEKEWELADLKAMKDACISDLKNRLQQEEVEKKRMQEEFQRKHAELDRLGREKEEALSKVKEAYLEREQALQNSVRELQTKLEDATTKIRQLEWTNQDLEKDKNIQIEKLREELQDVKEKWARQVVEISRGQVSKDLEVQNLREAEAKIKRELLQKKEDIERYKNELNAAVDREAGLERCKTQLELDWQRRFEDVERQQYQKSEELIKNLTKARDEAVAAVKEKERELQQKEMLMRVLSKDRVQALATLKKHGLSLDKNISTTVDKESGGEILEEFSQLQQQNESLKMVIQEMRKQMEELGQEIPHSARNIQTTIKGSTGGVADEYVKNLEKENRELRQKNRELDQDVDVVRKFGRSSAIQPPTNEEEVMSAVKDNALVRSHIQSLNDMIGSFRAEKTELSAQLKKLQARSQHAEGLHEKLAKESQQKQVEIDQLRYESGAQSRRNQAEIASLRQKVSELELQLAEARKEADEYYRGNLERNMEVTALRQELSKLKLDLAEKRPPINFGAEELVIQQLQDEILKLRQQSESIFPTDLKSGHGATTNETIHNLQTKLKAAAKKITELAKERQQLIEIGNKLRAELKKAGVFPPSVPYAGRIPEAYSQEPIREVSDHMISQPLSDQFLGKLNQLEHLQYQLTKQELQYAQRYRGKFDKTGETDLSDTENRPASILKKTNQLHASMEASPGIRASIDTEGGMTQASSQSVPVDRDLLKSMSSVGGESLQEIWKMLDERQSPSPYTPRTPQHFDQSGGSDLIPTHPADEDKHQGLYLAGRRPEVRQKSRQEKKLSEKAAGKMRQKSPNRPKIRNYNVKNDGVG
ncbi:hypothetical protein ACJMK2_035079 [Sinanodonta woodiana]|uniref:Coiled-coil domain-containing protein 57 n=1 Tax=Sinanodonta woodiana TaxID=1069815 RepID=A0ABD3WX80_SINWO